MSLCRAVRFVSVFFLSLTQERKECHCKIYCDCQTYWKHFFVDIAIFHIYLIQFISNLSIQETLISEFSFWRIWMHKIWYFIVICITNVDLYLTFTILLHEWNHHYCGTWTETDDTNVSIFCNILQLTPWELV